MGFAITTPGRVKEARANLDAGNVVASSWLWQRNSTVSQRYGCTDNPYEDSAPPGWCTNDPHGNRWHHGLDINDDINQPNPAVGCTAPYNTLPSGTGSPLYADGPGTVIAAGATSYGTIVEWQRDSDGYYVVLYHTQAITVHTNDRLFAGEQIAQVGNSGWPNYSTGCHLHFEIRAPPGGYWNDTDPTSYLSLSPTRFDLFAPDAVGTLAEDLGSGELLAILLEYSVLGCASISRSGIAARSNLVAWQHTN